MNAAGYRLAGPGPLTEAGILNATGVGAVGTVTSHIWSKDLDNAENKTLIDLFQKAYTDEETNQPAVPDAYAVEMWDAMRALDQALKSTKGEVKDMDVLIAALEVVSFKSPRGDFAFDKTTHNPIQDIYIREVKISDGKTVNAVIDTIIRVADPGM